MVTEQHQAFARAVVALAREHHMNNIDMTFHCSDGGLPGWEQVRMTWHKGRHGVANQIELSTTAKQSISE